MGIENLPPEMQERINNIIAQGVQQPEQPMQPPQPVAPPVVAKAPSLIDHVVALRQEVHELKSTLAGVEELNQANGQVLDAVGAAVAQMYQMFQPTSQQTYSQQFTQQEFDHQEDY